MLMKEPPDVGVDEDEYGEREPDPLRFTRGCLIAIGGGLMAWIIIATLLYFSLMKAPDRLPLELPTCGLSSADYGYQICKP